MGHITLADAKAWLQVTSDDEDAHLLALIEAASAAVDAHCGRGLARATVTETYEGHGSPYLFLRRTPVTAVASVEVLADRGSGGTAVSSYDFDVIAIRRTDGQVFPRGGRVRVTYTGGYEAIPGDVQLAVKMTVQAMRNAQAMDPNLMSESLGGVFGGAFDHRGPGAIPRAALTLLEPHRARYAAPFA